MSVNKGLPLTRTALIDSFHQGGRPRDEWLVGAEFERHLLRADGTPLPYFGEPGVGWLLNQLTRFGWKPYLEGDNTIALTKDGASVTLEPGGQFELSGAPFDSVLNVAEEALGFAQSVASILEGTGIHQTALGMTPFARVPDIGWVPKGRYVVMREHLGRTGDLSHHMMKGTAAVQASFDFVDEADCARKTQLAMNLGPLTTAMFANSPYLEGKSTGYASWRGHVWTRTDPARTGFPEAATSFTFERWVDYLLDAPMMFFQLGGHWTSANGKTFRSWMEQGHDGVFPTWADWELHTTSVFPEVRVKTAIEVRGADCVPFSLSMAFVSLFKGLFYCSRATREATELAARFTSTGTKASRFDEACRLGLSGRVGGRALADWASELLDNADQALVRCAPEDRPWLAPLKSLADDGLSPGEQLLQHLGPEPDPVDLLQATSWLPAH
jgi:glutamate--cysteine ligase